MNYSLESLLYGMQFRKLLEKELEPLEKEYGLCKIDMQIMLYLGTAGEHNTSKDIMQLKMFTRGHISQSLSRLQKKGYIMMEQDMEDRRCTHNHLTVNAGGVIKKLQSTFNKIQDIILQGVTEDEQRVLATVAQKVNQNINNVISMMLGSKLYN